MKAASRYAENTSREPVIAKPLACCDVCRWTFKTDNDRWFRFDDQDHTKRRRQPRTQIDIPVSDTPGAVITRCSDCYEKDLWRAGKHPKQGGMGEALYRTALFGADA